MFFFTGMVLSCDNILSNYVNAIYDVLSPKFAHESFKNI